MIAEVRANGCMTIFPGSVHPGGEAIRFDQDGDPTEIGFDELTASAQKLSALCLVLRHWRKGQRHDLALAVSGTLLGGRVEQEEVGRYIEALVRIAEDEEATDRFGCLETTISRLADGEPITGRKELAKLIGERSADRFCEWFGFEKADAVPAFDRRSARAAMRTFGGAVPESDVANADRFADHNKAHARYCHTLKKWLVWNGCQWTPDSDGEIERRAIATVKAMAIEAADRNDKDALTWAAHSHDHARVRSMLALSQALCWARHEAFDAAPWLLNCKSGVIDLQSGEHLAHDPARLMRRLAPTTFDHAAECPTFLSFLDRIFAGDRELIEFLQRAVGYSLTGRTDEQCLFVLVGNGANGKSTLIRVIQDLLGDYAQQTPMDALMTSKAGGVPNDIARLEGARFVAAVEAEAGQRLAEAKIKQLTGGDKIAARFLYAEHFEFTPQFKLWLATNRLPEVRGMDVGIWRRFRVLPFNVTIPEAERDGSLPDKLKAELPGILNWAIAGCLEWQKGGLRAPASVTDATKDYRDSMDLVMQFVEDCCLQEPGVEAAVAGLYDEYSSWCNANGELALSKKEFGIRLKSLGLDEVRTGKARKRRGIRLKTDIELLEALAPVRFANPADFDDADEFEVMAAK
jgi:putative DNA primase/helicase